MVDIALHDEVMQERKKTKSVELRELYTNIADNVIKRVRLSPFPKRCSCRIAERETKGGSAIEVQNVVGSFGFENERDFNVIDSRKIDDSRCALKRDIRGKGTREFKQPKRI